jgi:GTP cyclohydrolase II
MPSRWGDFQAIGFERESTNGHRRIETALALILGDLGDLVAGAPLVRIHSQCVTGEVLGSLRCDCGEQLEIAMQAIAEEGRGIVPTRCKMKVSIQSKLIVLWDSRTTPETLVYP